MMTSQSHLFLKRSLIVATAASLLAGASAHAATLYNNIAAPIPPNAKNYDQTSRPYICIEGGPSIAPGQSANISGDKEAAVRLGGCNDNWYVGWLSLHATASAISISNWDPDALFEWSGAQISANQLTGTIRYATINDNANLAMPLSLNRALPYVGVNLSGAEVNAEVDPYTIPDLSEESQGTDVSDLNSVNQYLSKNFNGVSKGINIIRLPISWSHLELLQQGSTVVNPLYILNNNYWDSLIAPTLHTLTKKQIYAIVDLHTYLRYPEYGVEETPDGTVDLDQTHYQTVWADILKKVKSDPDIDMNYLMFDLVNEPSDPITPQQAFAAQMPTVVYLQNNGFTGKILVEGAYWSGMHSWNQDYTGSNTPTNADVFTKANMINQGVRFDGADVGQVIINVHQYFDSDFSGTHNSCQSAANLNTTGINGFNFNAFTSWLTSNSLKAIVTETGVPYNNNTPPANCKQIFEGFLDKLVANNTLFAGLTLWGGGHSTSPDWDPMYFTPNSWQYTSMIGKLIP